MAFDPNKHLIQLKDKDYLEVKWRLLWFREEHPKGHVETRRVTGDNTPPVILATVYDEAGFVMGTGHGSATAKAGAVWSGREVEKAETAAIGRALALAGYGTQFTGEDEAEDLADAPVAKPKVTRPAESAPVTQVPPTGSDPEQRGIQPRIWTLQQKNAIVEGGWAENIFEAKGMLDASALPEKAGVNAVTSWAKIYRTARIEGKEVFDAARIANEAFLKAKSTPKG